MNTRTTLTTLAATTLALTLNTSAAGATNGTCTVTAQPFNNTSYHLAYTTNDGAMHTLIAHQDGRRLDPTSFDIPADFDAVYWATKQGRIDGPDSFYTVLHNAGGCQFVEPYNGGHSFRPSVIIGPGTPAPTTSTTVGTTTSSTVPPSTSTSAQPTPTAPTTTAPTDTTLPPVPVTRVTELPPATFPPTWPEQPGTTLPDKLDEVRLTPDPTPYTAVPRLPETGAPTRNIALFGLACLIPGALAVGLARLRNRHQHGRNFTAS